MRKSIDVAYTFGGTRWKTAAVSIISLLKNRKGFNYRIFCIVKPEFFAKKAEQKIMSRLVAKFGKGGSTIKFIKFDYDNASVPLTEDMAFGGGVCYYKLDLFALLPKVDRIIYLDDDTIILRPLDELATLDLGDKYMMAFRPGQTFKITDADTDRYGELQPFNAGVLVLNLKSIRASRVHETFAELFKDEGLSYEQGLLSAAFKDKLAMYDGDTLYNHRMGQDFGTRGKQIAIIHYTGKKPWFFPTRRFFTWWNYAERSPFFGEFLKSFLHNFLLYIMVMLIPSKRLRHSLRNKYSK